MVVKVNLRRKQESGKRNAQHSRVRLLGRHIPTKSISPWGGDAFNLGATRLRQPQANIVPVVVELNAGLGSRNDRKNVLFRSVMNGTLEDDQIRDSGASGEVFEAVVGDVGVIVCDLEVIVSWVDSAADVVVVFNDELLEPFGLLIIADHVGCS